MGSKAALLFLAVPLLAADLRIGVLSLFRPERITVRSTETLTIQAGDRTISLSPGQVAGLRAVNTEIDLFAQRQSSTSSRVTISGRDGAPVSFRLGIEGKMDRQFNGRLELSAVGSRLEPTVLVDLESAVAAVIAAEMPPDTPVEALKAMAVLARSYYAASGRRHGPYDFCDTTHCQWRRETIGPSHPAATAAQSTAGIILTYDNRPFAAMYHASCGGRTKSAAGIGLTPDPYPYFPVECEPCRRTAPEWSAGPFDAVPSTEADRLAVNRRLGRTAILSNTFVAESGMLTGRGNGHGLGVCQLGITQLARQAMDFRALLTKYLPQTRTSSLR
jgi:peptidoglycan hydrolase-like amidase